MSNNGRFSRERAFRGGRGAAGRRGAGFRWGASVGVGLLLVVNIVLLALLFDRPAPDEEPITSPGLTTQPTATAQPTPSAEPEPEPVSEPPGTAPSQYVLAAIDDSIAWRATTGACPDASATPERTVNGGGTWQGSDATGPTGITAIQRLLAASAEQVALIGYSADGCAPTLVRTFVGGEEFSTADDELDSAWYVPANDRAVIHSPENGLVVAPCSAVVAIAAASPSVAAVLCSDGTVHATSDAANSFSGGVDVAGAQALAASGDGWAVGVLGVDDCAGVAIAQLDAAATELSLVGCLPVDASPADLAGRVALANGAGTLWLWVGDTVARSASGGASWL
jgi:hypothetical protein